VDRRLVAIALAIAVSGSLIGCSTADPDVEPPPTGARGTPTSAAATTAPFFSFDGYGGIRIGMTRAEAEAAAAFPLAEYIRGGRLAVVAELPTF
jgi:hypothetical protein